MRLNSSALIGCTVVIGILLAPIHAVSNEDEDSKWARKSGLTQEEIRKLRKLTGVEGDRAAGYIDSIDTHSLSSHNQILLVTAGGNGHCLNLYVFARAAGGFRSIWAAEEKGYCRESPDSPEAYVTPSGRIVVKIPVYDNRKQLTKEQIFIPTHGPAKLTGMWVRDLYETNRSARGKKLRTFGVRQR
ncbi:MAG TPA: hypothetical protein VGV87_01700 [Blastocatellia bacterium]|nr:hypothetical protein [Blastocatellia bacterium]